jgi:spore coat protein B
MALNYMGYLMSLIGKTVKVNRGGPDSTTGTLLTVQSDYLALRTKDGILYVNLTHVKSITEVGGAQRSFGTTGGVIIARNFNELLARLRQHFVQLNSGGPEKIEGFVADVGASYLLLVSNKELVRVPIFHIKSVRLAHPKSNSSDSSQDNQNKSGGNRSGSSRSGGKGSSGSRSGGKGSSGSRSGGKRSGGNRSGGKRNAGVRQLRGSRFGAVKAIRRRSR